MRGDPISVPPGDPGGATPGLSPETEFPFCCLLAWTITLFLLCASPLIFAKLMFISFRISKMNSGKSRDFPVPVCILDELQERLVLGLRERDP